MLFLEKVGGGGEGKRGSLSHDCFSSSEEPPPPRPHSCLEEGALIRVVRGGRDCIHPSSIA